MAAVARNQLLPMPEIDIGEPRLRLTQSLRQRPRQSQCTAAHRRYSLRPLSGTVEHVIDTATLQIQGETIELAGIKGSARPIAISLRNSSRSRIANPLRADGRALCLLREECRSRACGSTNWRCPSRHDATPQYQQAADEARRNRRGMFQ